MKNKKDLWRKIIGDKPKEHLVFLGVLAISITFFGLFVAIFERSLRAVTHPMFIWAPAYLAFRLVYLFKTGRGLYE